MEKLVQISFVPALAFVLLSGDALASPVTASGTHCKVVSGSGYTYGTVGVANAGSSNITVACPIPMDASTLGSTVKFRMQVFDNSTTGGFSCTPYVFNQDGSQLAVGATRTTTAAQTGTFTLANLSGVDWTASVPGNVNTNVYAIRCSVPGNFSVVYTARAE